MAVQPLGQLPTASPVVVRRAQVMREHYGLLTNDSLILAAADLYGINCLATRDDDFDDVPWLTVYKPGDIP